MLLFLLGAVTAIMGGAFQTTPEMQSIKIILLVIFGVFVGIINISQEQEYGFLIASGVFVLCSVAITDLLTNLLLFNAISAILQNFIIFISPAAVIVAFKVIVEFASQTEWDIEKEEESMIAFYKRMSKKERIWDLVILFAVSIAIITMIMQLFYDVGLYERAIQVVTYIIAVIFIIDLVVLYTRAKSFRGFIKSGWLDIIAAVPLGTAFQLAKTLRFVRILKIVSKTQKATRLSSATKLTHIRKLTHTNQPTKFFSDKSGFNKYVADDGTKKRKK